MQWDGSATAGFTSPGVVGWLPVGDPASCNVAAQRNDPSSVLTFCRELIRLRREQAGQASVRYERLAAPAGIWRYAAGGVEVAANFTGQPATLQEPSDARVLLSTTARAQAGPAALAPWEGVIFARGQ
jgi:alpha-glucosidase